MVAKLREVTTRIESVRDPGYRQSYGDLAPLVDDISRIGLKHPITLWSDGTLISGARRLRAHYMLGGNWQNIRTVYVDNIEDAATRLGIDNADSDAMPWTDTLRLWEVLRKLDGPAYIKRTDEARRRGVELRRQTQAGARPAGRTKQRSDDYFLGVICKAYGISDATAARLWLMHTLANDPEDSRCEQAKQALKSIDAGDSSIWANYHQLSKRRTGAVPLRRQETPLLPVVPAPKQRAAWARLLPPLEGMVAGLIELGAPSPDLDRAEIDASLNRLKTVRRDIEKIINSMRENKA